MRGSPTHDSARRGSFRQGLAVTLWQIACRDADTCPPLESCCCCFAGHVDRLLLGLDAACTLECGVDPSRFHHTDGRSLNRCGPCSGGNCQLRASHRRVDALCGNGRRRWGWRALRSRPTCPGQRAVVVPRRRGGGPQRGDCWVPRHDAGRNLDDLVRHQHSLGRKELAPPGRIAGFITKPQCLGWSHSDRSSNPPVVGLSEPCHGVCRRARIARSRASLLGVPEAGQRCRRSVHGRRRSIGTIATPSVVSLGACTWSASEVCSQWRCLPRW